jgi:DNA-binding NtrC family response regulator
MKKNTERILIIDDDKAILRILTQILRKQGYDTDMAETGKETEEKIAQQRYDLALIDVKLPDADGIDLLSKIREAQPEIINIVITGFSSMENGIKAINKGADAYLVKPVQTEELIKIIEEKLKKHR